MDRVLRRGSMRRRAGPLVSMLVLALLATSCTGSEDGSTPMESPSSIPRGGTLRVVTTLDWPGILDPQRAYSPGGNSWELLRCCLLRTLVSYNGHPTEEGGSLVRPDLAASMPEVSPDGLTWTFRLRQGVRYGPPFQDTEIVAADIVRALEREGRIPDQARDAGLAGSCEGCQTGGIAWYYSIIEGFDAYRAGEADSISGLETHDEHTLVVRLTEPQGDLPYLFAMPVTAPIPEGAADGHLDYGRFLVASGPYMFEGSENLDPSLPPTEQRPVSGYQPSTFGKIGFMEAEIRAPGSLSLVRNPSWNADTDPLRGAFVDRIEVRVVKTMSEAVTRIERGEADILVDIDEFSEKLTEVIARYRSAPDLADRLLAAEGNGLAFMPMNVAMPPFDDVHVRKAVLLALDRDALVHLAAQVWGDSTVLLSHASPDSAGAGLLAGYDPYPEHSGDLAAARQEMALSSYDRDGDGRCDAPACRSIPGAGLAAPGSGSDYGESDQIREDLEGIGLDLDVTVFDEFWYGSDSFIGAMESGRYAIGATVSYAWIEDYTNGSALFVPMFRSDGSVALLMNLGADPERLRAAGLPVKPVPDVDDRIDRCVALTGSSQVRCWMDLDQYLMEEVVPLIPLAVNAPPYLTSERVVHASIDQWTGVPALDQLALAPGSE